MLLSDSRSPRSKARSTSEQGEFCHRMRNRGVFRKKESGEGFSAARIAQLEELLCGHEE